MKTIEELKSAFGTMTTIHNADKIIKDKKSSFTECNMNKSKEIGVSFFFNEKVSLNGNRRVNPCSITIYIEETEYPRGLRVSFMGDIWNSTLTDCLRGGQCLDAMLDYAKKANWKSETITLLEEIVSLWKKYHLFGIYSNYDGPIPDEDLLRIWSLFNM